jgi:uncharacterized membrane protein YjjB (DUF3815 family)
MSKPANLHDATGIIVQVPGVGILQAYGKTVPSDGAAGYATGCMFQHTDGGDNTSLYVNEGSLTSANFDAVTAGS